MLQTPFQKFGTANSWLLCIALLTVSCKVVNTGKYKFPDETYIHQGSKVYVAEPVTDTIQVYKLDSANKTGAVYLSLPAFNEGARPPLNFTKHTFDVDFLTIPLKFRGARENVPSQFNANLNGAVYFGYRADRYTVLYQERPISATSRQIRHLGLSAGVFAGLGNTFVSPTTTNNRQQSEYDGIVFQKGLAFIFGLDRVTFGFTLGFDNLLNHDKDIWIYHQKPWLGIAFGLNLN
ncbi:MAG TPA: hypothetical protein VLC98_08460 [Phnomibacter sp.]|nr:hypothetical protein [Phnomibacter sp.]